MSNIWRRQEGAGSPGPPKTTTNPRREEGVRGGGGRGGRTPPPPHNKLVEGGVDCREMISWHQFGGG